MIAPRPTTQHIEANWIGIAAKRKGGDWMGGPFKPGFGLGGEVRLPDSVL